MTNLLEQAINADDGSDAAKLVQNGLGIEKSLARGSRASRLDNWQLAARRSALLGLKMMNAISIETPGTKGVQPTFPERQTSVL